MLWMHALDIPVLRGIVISEWSRASASAVRRFCKKGAFSKLLLRIDRRDDRWTPRRGGYLISIPQVPATVDELYGEGRIAILLEPASPYADQYSMAGITIPERGKIVIEVVGTGFDASDILRGDLPAHERWELDLTPTRSASTPIAGAEQVHVITAEQYQDSVQRRLAKIGARLKNPAFPDSILKAEGADVAHLRKAGAAFLTQAHQTALLKHASAYVPIPPKHLVSFVEHVRRLLSGLAGYGIHLGATSFAASVIPKRGLIFWDFFPARKEDAVSLYPSVGH